MVVLILLYYFLKLNYCYLSLKINDQPTFFDNVNAVCESRDTVSQNK